MAKDWKEYERTVAKLLGEWWGWTFRRTPSSGAWATMGARMGHAGAGDFAGDVVAPPEAKFPFSVECKCYKDVHLYQHHYGVANVHAWWEQTLTDAHQVHKWPMLVMRQNNAQPLICISKKLWDVLAGRLDLGCHPVSILQWCTEDGIARGVAVMSLTHFLKVIPAHLLKKGSK